MTSETSENISKTFAKVFDSKIFSGPSRYDMYGRRVDSGGQLAVGLVSVALNVARFVVTKMPQFLAGGFVLGLAKKVLMPCYMESKVRGGAKKRRLTVRPLNALPPRRSYFDRSGLGESRAAWGSLSNNDDVEK